jgi:hypothetical protein
LCAHKVQPIGQRLRAAEPLSVLSAAGFVIHRGRSLALIPTMSIEIIILSNCIAFSYSGTRSKR